jgi:hypothetical protein
MAHSYAYLCRKAGLAPAKTKLRVPSRYEPTRYVRFHMPEIAALGEPAETRLVGFRSLRDREWLWDMASNYAAITKTLTTFFPDHP